MRSAVLKRGRGFERSRVVEVAAQVVWAVVVRWCRSELAVLEAANVQGVEDGVREHIERQVELLAGGKERGAGGVGVKAHRDELR